MRAKRTWVATAIVGMAATWSVGCGSTDVELAPAAAVKAPPPEPPPTDPKKGGGSGSSGNMQVNPGGDT